jgi:hypothetical protein
MKEDVAETYAAALLAWQQLKSTLPVDYFDNFTHEDLQKLVCVMWGRGRIRGLTEAQDVYNGRAA